MARNSEVMQHDMRRIQRDDMCERQRKTRKHGLTGVI
jgi:hypothetical protein